MFSPSQSAGLILQAQIALEKMCPATVRIGGNEYRGATRGLGVAASFTLQGETFEFDIVFRIRKTVLLDPPAIGSTIFWKDGEYRVKKVPVRPDDIAWYIGCEDPNK